MTNRIAEYFNDGLTEADILDELLKMEAMGLVVCERVEVDGVTETRWSLTDG